jgi:hypothetical protein
MKKVILMMSVLLSAGWFCACSSNDETTIGGSGGTIEADSSLIPADGVVLKPIELPNRNLWTEESQKVNKMCYFFNKGLPINKRSESFFVGSDKDECYIINSLQELKSIYCGADEIPELSYLDFDQYTLVIGQKVNSGAFYPMLKQDLTFLDNKCLLNIYVPDFKELNTTNVPFYYWALYPKFNTEGINVGFIREEGSVKTVENVYCNVGHMSIYPGPTIDPDEWAFAPYWLPGEDELFFSATIYPINLFDKVNEIVVGDEITFSGEVVKLTDDAVDALGIALFQNDCYIAYLDKIDVKEYVEVVPYRGTVPFTITDMPGQVCYDWDQQTYYIAYFMDLSTINPYYLGGRTIVTQYYPKELSDEFKYDIYDEIGKKVIISGNVYEDISISQRLGRKYKIELTKIELAE